MSTERAALCASAIDIAEFLGAIGAGVLLTQDDFDAVMVALEISRDKRTNRAVHFNVLPIDLNTSA